jgi:hypothetical protein
MILSMARGWESKAVEGQVQDLEDNGSKRPNRQLTSAQVESHRRKQVLLLSRSRVQKDLQASTDPRYREQLNRALADLDAQIAKFNDGV